MALRTPGAGPESPAPAITVNTQWSAATSFGYGASSLVTQFVDEINDTTADVHKCNGSVYRHSCKDEGGNYIMDEMGIFIWHPATKLAMDSLVKRGWVTIENQSPLIKGINDDSDALRIMQRAIKRVGAHNHYFFCGRDIIAHEAFNIPIETAWKLLNESQKGLSGVETHARLSITHYKGKTEVAAVTNGPIPGVPGTENGVVIFKILRNAAKAGDRGKVCIVARNPDAIWFDGYADRVIYDEAGLFEYSRVTAAPVGSKA